MYSVVAFYLTFYILSELLVAYKGVFQFSSMPTFTKHLIRPLTLGQAGPQNGLLSVYINTEIHAMFVPASCLCVFVVGAITVV